MKVTYKQLKAIIKLMTAMAELDQFEESEIQNIARFLDEFKLDHDKVKELLYSADQMELEEALSIIHELDRQTQQELSNRLFNLIRARKFKVFYEICKDIAFLLRHRSISPDKIEQPI